MQGGEVSSIDRGPRLLADVGGTNSRFTIETSNRNCVAVAVLSCAQYPSLAAAIHAYLGSEAVAALGVGPVRHAAIAIANPVDGDSVKMTNHHWSFSTSALRTELDMSTLLVVNDFTALAMALPHLQEAERVRIGGGIELQGRTIGLIGPGTGLGVSGIVPAGAGRWVALDSEGGHVTFAPANADEAAILAYMWEQYGHVSAERLLSGSGLEMILRALGGQAHSAAEITERALQGSCADCTRAVAVFCGVLGTVAGNVALTLGATGGMYIGGGIVPRLGRLFTESTFRARFEDKGRLSPYMARIPTYLITAAYPAFVGISAMLSEQSAHTS
jgi:glucokinase